MRIGGDASPRKGAGERQRTWRRWGALLLGMGVVWGGMAGGRVQGERAGAEPASVAGTVGPDGRFLIGHPEWTDLWVDPLTGDDSRSGSSRTTALRTLRAAWNRIPQGVPLTGTGWRVQLVEGIYPEASIPNYLEQRYGSASFPILLQGVDGPGKAVLHGDLNIFDCRYLYLVDLTIRPQPAGDTLHFEKCDHVLMRGLELDGGQWTGGGQSTPVARETLKINQSQYIYLEDCDIHGANDNAVDYVAVQYGHVIGNRIHNSNDWAMYVKGGAAYLLVEGNEFYDAGTGGFTCGQGTGFEFMTPPWLHYEAYDIKVINNLIHDTEGAGLGVNGGYNILMAWNTLSRVGRRSHVLEVVPGFRGCDGDTARCEANRQRGGWGGAFPEQQFIPNRNVFLYNNLIYNPPGYQSRWQHLEIRRPVTPPAGSNVATPARSDENLQIRGNVIWNGPPNHPLGIDGSTGCAPGHPTCNEIQIRQENAINTLDPTLVQPSAGDYRPVVGGGLAGRLSLFPPNFAWTDAPTMPAVPAGDPENAVPFDRAGRPRRGGGPPGALLPGQAITTVSAASFLRGGVAGGAIVSGFGAQLAPGIGVATELPLPATLQGVSVLIEDAAGESHRAPLFFVSPGQINFLVPSGTALGVATVLVTAQGSPGEPLITGALRVGAVAPGLFSADASGRGVPAAQVLRVRLGGEGGPTWGYEPISEEDPMTGRPIPTAIDLGPEGPAGEEVYLILFGTGWRQAGTVGVTLGGTPLPLTFAGGHSEWVGLDQINARLPRAMAGRGLVELVVTADGVRSNPLTVRIR
jgi:uncharacterized protein (TIGR03437 family)